MIKLGTLDYIFLTYLPYSYSLSCKRLFVQTHVQRVINLIILLIILGLIS